MQKEHLKKSTTTKEKQKSVLRYIAMTSICFFAAREVLKRGEEA